jgi:hypothetical protein
MKLINSINLAGIVGATISNLEKMFGIPAEIYLPQKYDTRTQHGDIKYQDDAILTRNLLFTNYIQNVTPTPGLKSFDIKEEALECYLPSDNLITTIPKRSLVVLKTAHGEEKYVITHIEALQGDAQTYITKWELTPSAINIDNDDEIEEAIEVTETQSEMYEEVGLTVDRLVFDLENEEKPVSTTPISLGEKTSSVTRKTGLIPDDVEVIL